MFLFCFVFLPLPLLRAVLSRVSRFNVRVIAPTSLAFYNSERKLESKTKCDKRSKRIAAYINIEKKKRKRGRRRPFAFFKTCSLSQATQTTKRVQNISRVFLFLLSGTFLLLLNLRHFSGGSGNNSFVTTFYTLFALANLTKEHFIA